MYGDLLTMWHADSLDSGGGRGAQWGGKVGTTEVAKLRKEKTERSGNGTNYLDPCGPTVVWKEIFWLKNIFSFFTIDNVLFLLVKIERNKEVEGEGRVMVLCCLYQFLGADLQSFWPRFRENPGVNSGNSNVKWWWRPECCQSSTNFQLNISNCVSGLAKWFEWIGEVWLQGVAKLL